MNAIFTIQTLALALMGCVLFALSALFVMRKRAPWKQFKQIGQRSQLRNYTNDAFPMDNMDSLPQICGLPSELTSTILKRLHAFEQSEKYVKKQYTLHLLAKELQTNSSYLSKVINSTKKMNFSSYLNNLKINYAMKVLEADTRFRHFTINAIAQEVGYNNAQSFSIAFRKKTGMHPSCFLRQLKKIDTSKS